VHARGYTSNEVTMMIAKPLLLAFLAACGVTSSAATTEPPTEHPDKQPPQDPGLEDQHFCCTSVSLKDFTGEGCTAVAKEAINSCPNVLYCPEGWAKSEGKVACE
jgi:hypothetical protein